MPEAKLSHHSKGRFRFRIAKKRGDAKYFKHLNQFFSQLKGIQSVEINPSFGSILLLTNLPKENLFDLVQKNNLFYVQISKINQTKTKTTISSAKVTRDYSKTDSGLIRIAKCLNNVDQSIKNSTYGVLDLTTLAFGAFAGLGIYQIARGQILASGTAMLATACALIPLQKIISEQKVS